MGSEDDKKGTVLSPRVGEDELGRILALKEHQEQKSLMATFAARYRKLGWELKALDTSQATELPVDFSQPREVWSQALTDFEAQEIPVGLGVRTGSRSQLLVVEISAGEGDLALDQLGEWRAECVAQGGDNLERHFYALPPGRLLPTASIRHGALITVYGEGGWVLAPPSSESPGEEPWRWLTPPWAAPPGHPPPALWQFIKQHLSETEIAVTKPEPTIPSWEEVYRLVSPCATILQALLAPADSPEEYYEDLLQAALGVGLKDPSLLLGLLWHAPHGDALQRAERWEYLLNLVTTVLQEHPEPEAPTRPLTEPPTILGDQVVIERFRYEALLLELRQLATRAAELEQKLAEWAQSFVSEKIPGEENAAVCFENADNHPFGFLRDWTDLEHQVSELVENFLPDAGLPEDQESFLENFSAQQAGSLQDLTKVMKKKAQQTQQEEEIEAAIQECLKGNPDLAEDERKVEMLYYCLKNYVNFHPDLMGLPLRDRVAEACRMARDFLGVPLKSNA